MLLYEICGLVSVGRLLWREDGSAICSVITQWSESRRTHNHTLLFHLRLPQPGGPGSRIYIPQEHGGPVIHPGTGFPLYLLLQLAGLRTESESLYSCKHICANTHSFLPRVLYMVWCLSKLYTDTIFVTVTCKCYQRGGGGVKEKGKKKKNNKYMELF
jgi:hypothetical protein